MRSNHTDTPLPLWQHQDKQREETAPMEDESNFLKELRDWMDQYMVSQTALSAHIGRYNSYLSNVYNPRINMPLDDEARRDLLAVMTAPGLPPRELLTTNAGISHSHLPQRERNRRYWQLRQAYQAAGIDEPAGKRQRAEQEPVKEEPMTEPDKSPMEIRLPGDLLAKLQRDADQEFRTPGQQVAYILTRYYTRASANGHTQNPGLVPAVQR